jgi:hypothetical protein
MISFTNNQNSPINTKQINCRLYTKIFPNFNPVIYQLSTYTSQQNMYTVVYITGDTFFPYGVTYVNFGVITNIPITYFSASNISFVIPNGFAPGNYNIKVINTTPATLNPGYLYSNVVNYTIT